MKVIVASWNPSKVKKIKHFLSEVPIEITSLSGEIEDIEETALTFEGNAALKVEAVRSHFPEDIIIGEDSGLTIDALEGFPGVKTARFSSGSDADRAEVLLEKLAYVPLSKRKAQFHSSISVSFPNGESAECHGIMPGWISNRDNTEIQGYGDIFLLSNGKVLSEIDDSSFNHQHQALFQAKQHILEWLKR
ncbi:non-canonical purine NTP pyrophosphatase [Cytobacillus gottheilii]|uniref:Non-canonical purine NTP pyrophosphatase n=1 Tax=Cytobacillus gottheilii TaxID=859144 RepID=A0ABX8FF57_9BACI|nr:non-canonical purine NTP pyrophosphatase [Cytobacillus gottheilii]QVY62637.1 non-canonical purine NTP pyrophosphatase [Cytobacillus gottheilii]